jgi:hypothetical protein
VSLEPAVQFVTNISHCQYSNSEVCDSCTLIFITLRNVFLRFLEIIKKTSSQQKKGKAIPVPGRRGSHIFQTIASQMAVRLSALRARRPLPPRMIPGTHFCYRLSRPQGHSAAGRIRSIEKSNDIGNRTRDLPACSIVPQPTALPRAPSS